MPDLTKPPSPVWQGIGAALNAGLAVHHLHNGGYAAAEAALMRAVGVPEPETDMRRYTEQTIANRATEIMSNMNRGNLRNRASQILHDEL